MLKWGVKIFFVILITIKNSFLVAILMKAFKTNI